MYSKFIQLFCDLYTSLQPTHNLNHTHLWCTFEIGLHLNMINELHTNGEHEQNYYVATLHAMQECVLVLCEVSLNRYNRQLYIKLNCSPRRRIRKCIPLSS